MYPRVRQLTTRRPQPKREPRPRTEVRADSSGRSNSGRARGARFYARLVLPVVVVTAAALLALLIGASAGRGATTDGDPYHAPAVVDTNPSPRIVETTLTARPATVNLGQGVQAHALTFNGSIPGPTFRVDVGDTVIVHFRNQLGEETGIHWHGVEVANPMDGTPVTQNQVRPGGTFRYQFTVTRPGVYWYHPHHHGSTNQVFKGLYGMIVVRDQLLEQLPQVDALLPPADRTLRLALSDATVCKAPGFNDSLTYDPSAPHVSGGPLPAQGPPTPRDLCETRPVDEHGVPRGPFAAGDIPNVQQADALATPTNEGQTVLTNGVNVGARTGAPENPGPLSPSAKTFPVVGNQQVRLQLVNASTTRHMRLRLTTPSGQLSPLLRIGGEGGLLDNSRIEGGKQGTFGYDTQFDRGEILLPPGGRADVLARMRQAIFSSQPPETGVYTLWTEDYLRTNTQFAGLPSVPVMHFQVSPPATNTFDGILFNDTRIRPADDPVETLPATTVKPLDPARFPTPKPGLASPQIGLTTDAGGFGIDGVHGTHDHTGDFMRAPHPPSTRYVRPGRTYTLSVANLSASRHPFHLHGFSIQPLDLTRVGGSVPIYTWDHREFVDTVDIPPGHILRFRVRIDRRPFPGNADFTSGGELGRWVMHCHIFSHAEDGMISELVVTGNLLEHNERPQMTIDNVDVTGIRGRTATASGTYADPDGDTVTFLAPRDADTDETIGTITQDGTDHGRWTWTYPVGAADHDRRVKIQASDDKLDVDQMTLDLHVQDPPPPAPPPTPTPSPPPAPAPAPTVPQAPATSSTPPAGTSAPAAPPALTRLRISPKRIAIGRRLPKLVARPAKRPIATIRFTLSRAAKVRLRFARIRPGRQPRRLKPTVRISAKQGVNRMRFAARLSRTVRLAPGPHRLTAVALDTTGQRSSPVRRRFRAIKRRQR
jgi:FtsP/CotA-like multicopper oxidase with cupredoxin domain